MHELVRTSAVVRVDGIVNSIADRPGRWAAIIGGIGTGKTWAVNAALTALNKDKYRVIRVECLSMETLSMAAIQDVLIAELGEKPLRFGPAKAVQLKRLLGAATGARGHKVILVLDEAHVLPLSVFRGLKRLRDMVFAAREGILSVLLVAQPELEAKLKSGHEARERITRFRMPPINRHDGERIVRALIQEEKVEFTDDAVREMAMVEVTPLSLENWVTITAIWCEERAIKKIDGGMLREVLKRTKDAVLNHYHISLGEIAAKAGVSKATASDVRAGKYLGRRETVEVVEAAIDELIAEKRKQGAPEPEPELTAVGASR